MYNGIQYWNKRGCFILITIIMEMYHIDHRVVISFVLGFKKLKCLLSILRIILVSRY